MQHISSVLADKIMQLFDEAGATELQRLSALDIAKALVMVWPNSIGEKMEDELRPT